MLYTPFPNLCREHKGEFSDDDILKQGAAIEVHIVQVSFSTFKI